MKKAIQCSISTFLLLAGLLFLLALPAAGQNTIANFVSVGGHDSVEPGYPRDASFSLFAMRMSDGSVRGQITDRLAPNIRFAYQAEVTCLSVNGNQAWISGVITHTTGHAYEGYYVIVRVRDNGTSKRDPVDEISLPVFGLDPAYNACDVQYGDGLLDLLPMPDGQVQVR